VFELWESGDAGYDSAHPFRSTLANYVLPTVDEWYKAAYYNPITGEYYDFATGSNTPPLAIAGGNDPGTAVYLQATNAGPANIMLAGGASPFGVVGMNGNVREWHEMAETFDVGALKIVRGGAWESGGSSMAAISAGVNPPELNVANVGFRVVSLIVPEPSTLVLWGLAILTMITQRRLIHR
jgi:formylglycine-generating enzyme required for sulfatase activity